MESQVSIKNSQWLSVKSLAWIILHAWLQSTVPAAAAAHGPDRPPQRPRPASLRWTALPEDCHHTLISGCRCSTHSGWLHRCFLSQAQILASWLKNLIEGFLEGSGGERKKEKKQLLKQLLYVRRRALLYMLPKICKQLSFSFTQFIPVRGPVH